MMKAVHIAYAIALLLLVVNGAKCEQSDVQQDDWRIQTLFKNVVIDGAKPYVQRAFDFVSNTTLWNFGENIFARVEDTVTKVEEFFIANYEKHVAPYTEEVVKRVVETAKAIPERTKQALQNLNLKNKTV